MKPFSSFEKPAANLPESEDDQVDDQLDMSSLFANTKKEQDKERETKKTDEKEAKKKKGKKGKDQQNEEKEVIQKPEKSKDKEENPEVTRRKRATLVERSFYYKKHYQEVPIPRNPWVIARLMVAEHILTIHDQIEQPSTHENAPDELTLLATLDYMGVIADKLENPEIESTPEVEETIETIIQLATETLQEDDEDIARTVITANSNAVHIQSAGDGEILDQPQPPVNSPAALPPVAAALINVIQQVRQAGAIQAASYEGPEPLAKDHHIPAARPVIGFGGGTSSRSAPPTVVPDRESPARPTPSTTINTPVPAVIPHLEAPRTYHPPVKHEVFSQPSHRSAEPLAALAVATALAAPRAIEKQSIMREYAPMYTPRPKTSSYERPATTPSYAPPVVHQNEIYRPQPKVAHTPAHIQQNHEILSSAPTPLHTEHTYSSRELEHMRLEPLLKLAENVPIGHGQRLRRAYEKGMIDKEGLVKILKSRAKNHDFLREYTSQVTKQRNLVQASPEFLHSAPSRDNQFAQQQKNEPARQEDVTDVSPDAAPARPAPLPTVKPTQQASSDDSLSVPDEKTSNSSWLRITLGAVFILIILVLFLLFVI